ncbi:unnamed protein product [Symbiodinium sp. CCMP2592]|nr:unnamed protein product [Symbiodinium sp. CCMP2592]
MVRTVVKAAVTVLAVKHHSISIELVSLHPLAVTVQDIPAAVTVLAVKHHSISIELVSLHPLAVTVQDIPAAVTVLAVKHHSISIELVSLHPLAVTVQDIPVPTAPKRGPAKGAKYTRRVEQQINFWSQRCHTFCIKPTKFRKDAENVLKQMRKELDVKGDWASKLSADALDQLQGAAEAGCCLEPCTALSRQ